MKPLKTIEFRLGEETKPVIVDSRNYKDSMFGVQIAQALRVIETKTSGISSDLSREGSIFNDIYDNNIISFIGERGSGKTSCMYSVLNVLQDHNQPSPTDTKKPYCFIDTVDPSFFDVHHNILQIIIGKIYGKFKEKIKDSYGRGSDEHTIQELRTMFRETKKHLKHLQKEVEFGDDNEMEELHRLSFGVDLRRSIKSLVTKFLEYEKSRYLVITIDDIDLNPEQAYEMAEQVRKYLILPNVIILMAVKLDQLAQIIKLRMLKEYGDNTFYLVEDYLTDMTDRYIVKLLPLESRIHMPSMEVFYDIPLIYIGEDGRRVEFDDVRTAVVEMIFKKCRYLFYHTKGTTSYIVPRNLRDLRMLTSMLMRMSDDVGANQDIFKSYFFDDWLNHLNSEQKDLAQRLIAEDEPTRFNKRFFQLATNYFREIVRDRDVPSYIRQIVKDENVAYNVSIGDVMTFLDYISKIAIDTDEHRLIFFIKSLYSIRLYEYYNQRTDGVNADAISGKQPKDTRSYRKDDILENVSNLQKLVGGNFFYLSGQTFIPEASVEKSRREQRPIDGDALNRLIRDLVARFATIKGKEDDAKIDFTEDLRMAEFFMLTTTRYFYSKSGGKDVNETNYRKEIDAYYDKDLSGRANLVFEATAPFFTLLDVKHTYGRFHEKIFEIAKAWDGKEGARYMSLYNVMIGECHNRTGYKPVHDFLSKATIRNIEISEDLYQFLVKNRGKYRPDGGGVIKILSEFYKTVYSYQISTYDYVRESDGSKAYYDIKFVPFNTLAEYLGRVSDEVKFYSIYNKDLARRVSPYYYVKGNMTREDVWQELIAAYPPILQMETALYDFNIKFKSATTKYKRKTIIEKLMALASKWNVKLDGALDTNAPSIVTGNQ